MAKRTAKITLDDQDYTIHAFNIGEMERLSEIIGNGSSDAQKSWAILRLALERAEPKIEDVGMIEATPDQTRVALETINQLSGLTANPPVTPGAS